MSNQRLKKENRANQELGRSAVAVMQSLGPNGITKTTDIAAGVPGLGPRRFRAAARSFGKVSLLFLNPSDTISRPNQNHRPPGPRWLETPPAVTYLKRFTHQHGFLKNPQNADSFRIRACPGFAGRPPWVRDSTQIVERASDFGSRAWHLKSRSRFKFKLAFGFA
jgi:hypothetical protein